MTQTLLTDAKQLSNIKGLGSLTTDVCVYSTATGWEYKLLGEVEEGVFFGIVKSPFTGDTKDIGNFTAEDIVATTSPAGIIKTAYRNPAAL